MISIPPSLEIEPPSLEIGDNWLRPSYQYKSINDLIGLYLRKKPKYEFESLNPSSGDIVVTVNAVDTYRDLLNGNITQINSPEIDSWLVNREFTYYPTERDFITIKAESYNDIHPEEALQKVDAELRHHFDKQTIATAGTYVSTKSFGIRTSLQRLVYKSWFVNLGLSGDITERGPLCGLAVSTNTLLWENVRGFCRLNLGPSDGVTCSMVKAPSKNAKASWELGLHAGRSSSIEIKSVIKLEEGIRLYSTAGLDDGKNLVGVEFGLSQTIDRVSNSRANCGIRFSYLRGMSIILRFQKGNNRIQIPITFCNEIDNSNVDSTTQLTCALFLPVVFYGIYKFYLKPRARRKREEKKERTRHERKNRATALRDQAEHQQKMQKPVADEKMQHERKTDGLVISEAWYGKNVADQLSDETLKKLYLEAPEGEDLDNTRINAKIPMQFLVKSGTLQLVSSTKSLLPGLYDVAEQETKQLFIKYTYRGVSEEVVIGDEQSLVIGAEAE